jgi:hypothetical protein
MLMARGKVEARSRSAGCGRREEGQRGRMVEAIGQAIAAPASSHVGELEHVQLSADVHPLRAHSRVRSCSPPSLQGMGVTMGKVEASKMV